MSEATPVVAPLQIRWRDLDALGHVNNAVYLTYFELGRLEYIRALLGPDAFRDRASAMPAEFEFLVAEVTIRYRSPAVLADQLQVETYVSQVGRKSFVYEYRIRDLASGRLVAEGCSTQVWYDYAAGESRPVPAAMVARMEALQGAPIRRV